MKFQNFPVQRYGCMFLLVWLALPIHVASADTGDLPDLHTERAAMQIAPPVAVSVNLLSQDTSLQGSVTEAPTSVAPASATQAVLASNQFGTAADLASLDNERGGAEAASSPFGGIVTGGTLNNNRAADVVTGSNAIREGSFANASGIPVVIQNTGANVLIQNATIVNVQLR